MVRSGQMTRQAALEEIAKEEYPYDETLLPYVLSKLDLSTDEFDRIMWNPNKTFHDYSSYYPLIRSLRGPITFLNKFNIFPKHLYLKFLG
jgi:hypothetical protein